MVTKGEVKASASTTQTAVAAPASAPSLAGGETAALVSLIERAARDPAIDIEKMERLFHMHERAERRRAETAFNAAMAQAQAALVPVTRNAANSHTNSRYADLSAIHEAAMPLINAHGFGLSFGEFKSDEPGCMGIACEVTHAGGHSKSYRFNVPLDGAGLKGNTNKTATQTYGSTFTYGRRYATLGVFNIAVKNDLDGNRAQPAGLVGPAQAEELARLISEAGVSIANVLAAHNIESLSDMPAREYQGAKAKLLAHKRARQARGDGA